MLLSKGATVLVRKQVEVSPGIHIVPGARWSRVYLIVDETLTLVDSGLPWHPRGILNYIRAIGRRPDELKHILVTHSHPDHVGGTLSLVRKTRAAIVAHRSDTRPDRHNDLHLGYTTRLGPIPVPIPLFARTSVDLLAEDGDTLPLHGGIRVIHTPGHTRGSVCFLLEESKILFTGDTIFSDGRSISRSVPFPGYDQGQLRPLPQAPVGVRVRGRVRRARLPDAPGRQLRSQPTARHVPRAAYLGRLLRQLTPPSQTIFPHDRGVPFQPSPRVSESNKKTGRVI